MSLRSSRIETLPYQVDRSCRIHGVDRTHTIQGRKSPTKRAKSPYFGTLRHAGGRRPNPFGTAFAYRCDHDSATAASRPGGDRGPGRLNHAISTRSDRSVALVFRRSTVMT